MSPLLWTSKSVRKIETALKKGGYSVSHELIRQILIAEGYSLQSNRKTKEGGEHPDRDAQFEFINQHTKEFIKDNQPVISVDCKKKELIGEYKNGGKNEYQNAERLYITADGGGSNGVRNRLWKNELQQFANDYKTGLTVKAKLDEKIYPTGVKISNEDFEKINIKRNNFHSDWNYIIYPN